jgi:hypothetical protein
MKERAKFDLDLKFGEAGEQWLVWLASERKVEVKRERDKWRGSGNLFFEYESRGKASGVAITAADFWVHILSLNGENVGSFIFPVPSLKRNLRVLLDRGIARMADGGDEDSSKGLLVPLRYAHHLFNTTI